LKYRRKRLDRAEKKAVLMQEAERLIEELLVWEGENEAPNLVVDQTNFDE
jgi:hypothetical protein